ncbi:MAG: hypothetical protein K0R89_1693 [Ramlibacter sp.]|jgi:hypothetical protein|nr:hypothetical protein [Ramlibacter sp.]
MNVAAKLFLACCAWYLLAGQAFGQGLGAARESAVKAAFLFKFGSFVEWPPGALKPGDAFVIAVFGDDNVAAELEQLTRGRTVEGHPVSVQRVREGEELAPVHILFAGGPREARARDIINTVRGPVLTVTDSPLGSRPGAVLAFVQEDGRVRFSASLPAATARGIRLSAKLLAVAQQVEGR